ncbi:MAG: hypothetical protein EOP24_37800 [Hyphomicrobiales bacterium]|nr:MAG: hypothetical protein EOP24_37800 [Hyphomicrobiales bacterium]
MDHACYIGGFVRAGPVARLHPQELRGILADVDPAVMVVDGVMGGGCWSGVGSRRYRESRRDRNRAESGATDSMISSHRLSE